MIFVGANNNNAVHIIIAQCVLTFIVGEQASMFSLNLSASRKPRQNHVPAYEVTPEETRKGKQFKYIQPVLCIICNV